MKISKFDQNAKVSGHPLCSFHPKQIPGQDVLLPDRHLDALADNGIACRGLAGDGAFVEGAAQAANSTALEGTCEKMAKM